MDAAEYTDILATLADYGRLLDDGQVEEWYELFTAETRFTSRGTTYVGQDGLRHWAANRAANWLAGVTGGKHLFGIPVLTDEGAGRCSAWVDFVYLRRSATGIEVASTGRYHDQLIREFDRWRFAERNIVGATGF